MLTNRNMTCSATLCMLQAWVQGFDPRDENPIIKAAAEKKPPGVVPSEGACLVSRYHATRSAAVGSQDGDAKAMYQKGIESIEHGLHLLKSSLQVSNPFCLSTALPACAASPAGLFIANPRTSTPIVCVGACTGANRDWSWRQQCGKWR